MTPPAFPAGEYVTDPDPPAARRAELVAELAGLPARVRTAVAGLTDPQLDTPYNKWTVRQIVHHLADSHANAYARFRLALTEDLPTIKPYNETRWAELPDARTAAVGVSLHLLEALHARWAELLGAMTAADFARRYRHPEYGTTPTLGEALGLYAHHGRHHAGQLGWLRQRHGW